MKKALEGETIAVVSETTESGVPSEEGMVVGLILKSRKQHMLLLQHVYVDSCVFINL